MTRTPAERTIAAQVRAVEEGHQARLAGDGRHFLILSDSLPGVSYQVGVHAVGETVVFTCDCCTYRGAKDPARMYVPDKHAARAALRLEREGLLSWAGDRWTPTPKAVDAAVDDPFDGLGQ